MPIQGPRRTDLYVPESTSYLIDNTWQVPFEMDAKRKEIGNHQDVVDTPRHQRFHGAFQAGLPQLQKCRFHGFEPPGGGELAGDGSYGLISRVEARAVGENDDSGGQVP